MNNAHIEALRALVTLTKAQAARAWREVPDSEVYWHALGAAHDAQIAYDAAADAADEVS